MTISHILVLLVCLDPSDPRAAPPVLGPPPLPPPPRSGEPSHSRPRHPPDPAALQRLLNAEPPIDVLRAAATALALAEPDRARSLV